MIEISAHMLKYHSCLFHFKNLHFIRSVLCISMNTFIFCSLTNFTSTNWKICQCSNLLPNTDSQKSRSSQIFEQFWFLLYTGWIFLTHFSFKLKTNLREYFRCWSFHMIMSWWWCCAGGCYYTYTFLEVAQSSRPQVLHRWPTVSLLVNTMFRTQNVRDVGELEIIMRQLYFAETYKVN